MLHHIALPLLLSLGAVAADNPLEIDRPFGRMFGAVAASPNTTIGCPTQAFLQCILQLRDSNVHFDSNILRAVLSIDSEAKLLHTCRAYSEAMPCFRERLLECGNEHQYELFGEVGRALVFLCSPFSVERQRTLIQYRSCVATVLSRPVNVGCKLPRRPYGERLLDCKKHCATMPRNLTCALRSWMSEQNACTLQDIDDTCGFEAAGFYADFQASVFEPTYPFVCDSPPLVPAAGRYGLVRLPTTTTELPPPPTAPDRFAIQRLSTRLPPPPPKSPIAASERQFSSARTPPPKWAATPLIVTNGRGERRPATARLSTRTPPPFVMPTTAASPFLMQRRGGDTEPSPIFIKSPTGIRRLDLAELQRPTDATPAESQPTDSSPMDPVTPLGVAQLTPAHVAFIQFLHKLLPIALRQNMTEFLQRQAELIALSRQIDLSIFMENSTATVEPATVATTSAPRSPMGGDLFATSRFPATRRYPPRPFSALSPGGGDPKSNRVEMEKPALRVVAITPRPSPPERFSISSGESPSLSQRPAERFAQTNEVRRRPLPVMPNRWDRGDADTDIHPRRRPIPLRETAKTSDRTFGSNDSHDQFVISGSSDGDTAQGFDTVLRIVRVTPRSDGIRMGGGDAAPRRHNETPKKMAASDLWASPSRLPETIAEPRRWRPWYSVADEQ